LLAVDYTDMNARNALLEARQVVGDYDPRVLEPSPPAVLDGVWFADDPAVGGNLDWREWVGAHPEHEVWAADRWLAAYRRLGPVPPTFAATRLALHRVAVYVVSPARQRSNGKMALRWTLGGIGTPFFGGDEQVRVAGTDLVRQRGSEASAETITSLAKAATFVLDGPPEDAWAGKLEVPPLGDADEDLAIDPNAACFLADWYGFAWSVLEEVRADASSPESSRVQLWPEHFDAAFDCLAPERRATLGASPGDRGSAEPYLYVVSPRVEDTPSPLWNATTFPGAVLRYEELLDTADQRAMALEFFRARRDLLAR
jgi:hypothetical protein